MAIKIWIDEGHGGAQPGAVALGRKEKDLTLLMGNALAAELSRCGFTVNRTRTTDVDIQLSTRAAEANKWGADYFISLHLNAFNRLAKGAETFCSIGDSKSKGLADCVQAELVQLGYINRGVKEGSTTLAVIRQTKMPAVLAEVGFLDNPADMALFDADKAAQAIAKGICKHTRVAYKQEQTATIRADTSGTITIPKGKYYQLRTFSAAGASVAAGNPANVVIVPRNVARGADGAEDWYIVPIGDKGSSTGIYISNIGDKAGQQCCVVKIG